MSDRKQELVERFKIDIGYGSESTFKYIERDARYGLLKDKNVALVRIEYHYKWKNKLCLAYRHAWLTRQQLTDLYNPHTGLVENMRDDRCSEHA